MLVWIIMEAQCHTYKNILVLGVGLVFVLVIPCFFWMAGLPGLKRIKALAL